MPQTRTNRASYNRLNAECRRSKCNCDISMHRTVIVVNSCSANFFFFFFFLGIQEYTNAFFSAHFLQFQLLIVRTCDFYTSKWEKKWRTHARIWFRFSCFESELNDCPTPLVSFFFLLWTSFFFSLNCFNLIKSNI